MICYIDGGYDNIRKRNPYASVRIYNNDGTEYGYASKLVVDAKTNNEAEYQALLLCLFYLDLISSDKENTVYSDSKLMVNQVNGNWKINSINLYNLKLEVDEYRYTPFELKWLPREEIFKQLGH